MRIRQTIYCDDCQTTHPTKGASLQEFIHMLRSHRDPFFDDTIDALIDKLEELVKQGIL